MGRKNLKILILYNALSENPAQDEMDVLDQVTLVEEGLSSNVYQVEKLEFSLDVKNFLTTISKVKPDLVFNLVESVDNDGKLICLAPGILEHIGIPYTGTKHDQMFICQNKVVAKELMVKNNILTPSWLRMDNPKFILGKQYLVKPIWEDGSLGIDDDKLFTSVDESLKNYDPSNFFLEEYVDGREFNVAILAGEVLEPAEIVFRGFEDIPKILGYKAKWEEDSFQYKNTFRTFDIEEGLRGKLKVIGKKCWELFNMKGYARVDFRMDSIGKIYVLEVNPNPCISPDSGFIAAAQNFGYSKKDVVEKILNDF